MIARRTPWILAAVGVALAGAPAPGCASRDGEPAQSTPEQTAGATQDEPAAPATIDLGEGPGGEIVPGLALPPGTTPPSTARPGAAAPDPDKLASQEELLAAARQALADDRPGEALAIIDVLVVLDPADSVVIELRASTLERLGDREGATADRERCCEIGRAACCP